MNVCMSVSTCRPLRITKPALNILRAIFFIHIHIQIHISMHTRTVSHILILTVTYCQLSEGTRFCIHALLLAIYLMLVIFEESTFSNC